jgi:hypothetical protein
MNKELNTLATVNKSLERNITDKYQHKPQCPSRQPNRNVIVTTDSNKEIEYKHLIGIISNCNTHN